MANGTQKSPSLGGLNFQGITLPSSGTATGNEPGFSPVQGTTQVFVDASLPQGEQAATIAAELGTHALPALLGQGAAPLTDADHNLVEVPLVHPIVAKVDRRIGV
jgi:hypothetical protein